MVSLKEIAKECNVSVSTVSKALNGYLDIGEETRRFIREKASAMGYLPNSSARTLKTKRSYNLAVLCVDDSINGLTHDYFNHVLDSFKNEAEDKGFDITFATQKLRGDRMTYLEHCLYRGVDGVLIACVDFSAPEVLELIHSDIPLVTLDHVFDGRLCVVSNNVQGMDTLTSFVCEMGHKRIAYIHGGNTSVTRNRLTGFYRALRRHDISVPEEYVLGGAYRDVDIAAARTGELLSLPVPPSCILYSDDYAAIGGINEIRERGLRIPEDVSVAGYDGIRIAQVMEPKLTTLCQDTATIGKMCAQKLIELIESPKHAIIDKFTVDGILFRGSSVRECR